MEGWMEGSLLSCHQVLLPGEGLILTLCLALPQWQAWARRVCSPCIWIEKQLWGGKGRQMHPYALIEIPAASAGCQVSPSALAWNGSACSPPEVAASSRAQALSAELGLPRGCENPSPSRGPIPLPFASAQATWTLSERESCCQGFTDLFSF